uniref:Uncharacterized protein n=1 Tax=Romanomermis culicivorax TaxID=13658 RepID=A0A915L237_ROMCU
MNNNWLPWELLQRERPHDWRIQRTAPKKTWLKHVEEDVKNQRLAISKARDIITGTDSSVLVKRTATSPSARYGLKKKKDWTKIREAVVFAKHQVLTVADVATIIRIISIEAIKKELLLIKEQKCFSSSSYKARTVLTTYRLQK